ncbi:hypothetical protein ACH4F6_02000 [Streptomyces sp. NPDC017936]|uniref:hypothetical protein n=1 Tax=Streptomyces sp. NPDC017936 TaxID=3365016 RepID=UPI00378C72CE
MVAPYDGPAPGADQTGVERGAHVQVQVHHGAPRAVLARLAHRAGLQRVEDQLPGLLMAGQGVGVDVDALTARLVPQQPVGHQPVALEDQPGVLREIGARALQVRLDGAQIRLGTADPHEVDRVEQVGDGGRVTEGGGTQDGGRRAGVRGGTPGRNGIPGTRGRMDEGRVLCMRPRRHGHNPVSR